MRVLLINANRSSDLLPPPPLGLAYVATSVSGVGHDVSFLDLLTVMRPTQAVLGRLRAFEPDVVGVSFRNLDNAILQSTRSQVDWTLRLITTIKAHTNAPVVVGGPAASILGSATLSSTGADHVVCGDGEDALPELLSALANGRSVAGIPGICSAGDNGAGPATAARLPEFSASGMERWVKWPPYERRGSTWGIQTKRGCPLGCSYCAYVVIEGRQPRFRDPDDVAEEVERVARVVGPRTFEVVDSTFNLPEDHALAVCEAVARRSRRHRFTAEGISISGVSEELLAAMKSAGFNSLMLSPESASDEVLRRLHKGFGAADVARAVELVHRAGMTSLWFFMLGCPGETRATADETLAFIERHLARNRCLVVITTGIRILPGAELATIAAAEGQVHPGDDPARPAFYVSPSVSEAWLLHRVNQTIASCPNVVHAAEEDPSVLQHMIQRLYTFAGGTPPFWRFLPSVLRVPMVHRYRVRHPVVGR